MNKSLTTLICLGLLSGCTIPGHLFESKKTDYKAEATTHNGLDVPPDLSPVQTDDRFAIPESSATLSQYNQTKRNSPQLLESTDNSAVLPTFSNKVTLQHDGDQRWLLIHQSAEQVWPVLEAFWAENGVKLQSDNPKIGVMETEWTDNHNASPQGTLGKMMNTVVSNLFSSPVRDQFRLRIERVDATHTELYLFHKRVEEVLNHDSHTGGLWQPMPDNREIETEYLKKLAVKLGESSEQADTLVSAATTLPSADKATDTSTTPTVNHGAQLNTAAENSVTITMPDSFDRAWRRVGLALDRSAFTVEDRDRATGVYFIRYTTDEENRKKATGQGFFSKLAFWRSEDKTQDTQTYRLTVTSVSGRGTTVDLRNKDETKANPDTTKRILTLIYDQLR